MSFEVGQRLEARCTRCKIVTGHVVVFMIDDAIAKVDCCACGSVHKYYPPEAKKTAKAAKPIRVRSGEERTDAMKEKRTTKIVRDNSFLPKGSVKKTVTASPKVRGISSARKEEMEKKWREAIAASVNKPIPYSMDSVFNVDDLVKHPTFGVGVVLVVHAPDKVEISFEEGIKSLRCRCT